MSTSFSKTARPLTPVGRRLLEAYDSKGISSKKAIGEALGFKSDKSIYKVLNGEQELSFEALRLFRESTGRSVDWLLFDADALEPGQVPIFFGPYEQQKLSEVAKEAGKTFEEEIRDIVLAEMEKRGMINVPEESNVVFYGEPVRAVELPLMGWIAAGEPLHLVTEKQMVSVPDFMMKKGKQHFVLHVRGDSMIEDQIPDNSLIICEARQDANDGEKVVAVIDGDKATVKRIYHEADRIRLQPANPLHKPIYLDSDRQIEIQGVVVAVFHKP